MLSVGPTQGLHIAYDKPKDEWTRRLELGLLGAGELGLGLLVGLII